MIDALALALAALSAIASAAVLGSGVLGRFRRVACTPVLTIVQCGLVLQAVLDVVAWIGGHHPGEPGTHAAYLVTSLLPLPLAALETRRDDGLWSAVLLAVAFAVVAVLVVRMQATWR